MNSVVAGARHLTQGKNLVDLISIENQRKPNTASILLAQTIPTLMQTFEPNVKEFKGFLQQGQSHHFTGVSPLQVALITEITLD